jgi:hypothetical protein
MKKQVVAIAVVVAMIAAVGIGCAGKAPVMQDGKQVALFVLSDRGIKAGMKEEEVKDRNEMGQGMEEDMVRWMKREGYNGTLIQTRNQYVEGPSNYLVMVRINDLRLVGRAARQWTGMVAGPTTLKNHYEVSGTSNKVTLSYDDEESTFRDWMAAPQEMTIRLVTKINEKLNVK